MDKLGAKTWIGLLCVAFGIPLAAKTDLALLDRLGRINGSAIDPNNPGKAVLATRQGFFSVAPDGFDTPISDGGVTWNRVATAPERLFAIAASTNAKAVGSDLVAHEKSLWLLRPQ